MLNNYSILFLSFFSVHIIAMTDNVTFNVYNNESNDSCAVGDKGRIITINHSEETKKDPINISFDPKTTYLTINNMHIKTPFNCFAQVQGKLIYGIRINEQFYVNAQIVDMNLATCNDDETCKKRHTMVLKNMDISIVAPLCTFKEDPNLVSTICLEGSKFILQRLHIIEYETPNSLKIKYIEIKPENRAAFITNKPIMCYVPVGTRTFDSYEEYSTRLR